MPSFLTQCLLTNVESLVLQVLAFACPFALVLRSAALLGPVQLPWRFLAGLSGAFAVMLTLPPSPAWEGLALCDALPKIGWEALAHAAIRGLLLALQIRCSLLLIESIAGALEAHLQLSQTSSAGSGGALSALTLSVWANEWWLAHSHTLLTTLQNPNAPEASIRLDDLLLQLLEALAHSLGFAAMALLVLVFAELGLGFIQRAFPQLAAWQLTLPLRLVLSLQIMRLILSRPLGWQP